MTLRDVIRKTFHSAWAAEPFTATVDGVTEQVAQAIEREGVWVPHGTIYGRTPNFVARWEKRLWTVDEAEYYINQPTVGWHDWSGAHGK